MTPTQAETVELQGALARVETWLRRERVPVEQRRGGSVMVLVYDGGWRCHLGLRDASSDFFFLYEEVVSAPSTLPHLAVLDALAQWEAR